MTKQELQEITNRLNKRYYKKTGNRLVFREVLHKWYLCEMVPLGEQTLASGTLEECVAHAENLAF